MRSRDIMMTPKTLMVVLAATVLAGCVPAASYRAYQEQIDGRESFAINDTLLRVDPAGYPLFAIKEAREAPRSNINIATGYDGSENPTLRGDYLWRVTHAFNGRFLIHSTEYEKMSCLGRLGGRNKRPENCEIGAKGHFSNIYVYLRPTGDAYGWQYLRNQDWYVLRSDKVSYFRIDASGDWSGQPWFECVARCDKLESMKREEIEGGDPFGTQDMKPDAGLDGDYSIQSREGFNLGHGDGVKRVSEGDHTGDELLIDGNLLHLDLSGDLLFSGTRIKLLSSDRGLSLLNVRRGI